MADSGINNRIDFPERLFCRHARIRHQNTPNTQQI